MLRVQNVPLGRMIAIRPFDGARANHARVSPVPVSLDARLDRARGARFLDAEAREQRAHRRRREADVVIGDDRRLGAR